MEIRSVVLAGAALLLATPLFATKYYGGVEDWNGLDYDYNDVVFSLSGNNLVLNSATGHWFEQPALGTSGTPFWNHSSLDGPNYNTGYCMYGGGSCNGGKALDAGAEYLAANATSKTGSANDVTFSSSGAVMLSIAMDITAGMNRLGWYSAADPTAVNWLSASTSTGSYTFNPSGAFGLVDQNLVPYFNSDDYSYYSQSWIGSQDTVSHFAFFGDPATNVVPEPGVDGLVGLGLLSAAFLIRKRKQK